MSRRGVFALALFLLISAPSVQAASNYYLKLDGVEGESQDKDHRGWTDILSWSWGATNPPTAQGAGRCNVQDFNFVKLIDKSSPKLLSLSAGNTSLPQAVVEIRGERHLLQNVKLSGYKPVTGRDGRAAEQMTLRFARCATHGGDPAAAVFPKVEYKLKAQSPTPVAIALLLPAVQKVRDAAVPQGAIDEILIGLSKERPGTASIAIRSGGQGAALLQRAFQTQQKLEFMELARKDQPYMKIKFNDILITSFHTGGVMPSESLSLNYEEIKFTYSRMEGDANAFKDVETSWSGVTRK
jgi:type VI protein secretion system component Hcp